MASEKKSEKSELGKMKPAELEKLVVELAKKGETPAKIGLILRDKHAVPKAKLLGRKITQILRDAKIPYKTDRDVLNAKVEKVRRHIELHKHDCGAKKSLTKTLWSLRDMNALAELAK